MPKKVKTRTMEPQGNAQKGENQNYGVKPNTMPEKVKTNQIMTTEKMEDHEIDAGV